VNQLSVGLQLWSLRDDAKQDFVGTLKQVANMGYAGVEFAGYGGLGATELKKVVTDLGLKPVSSHVGYEQLKDHLPETIEYAVELGLEYVVCPGAPREALRTLEDWRGFGQFMSSVADECSKHGLIVGYHNHAWEFDKVEGKHILDIIFESASPKVQTQLDLGWVFHAGVDPVKYLLGYKGRCPTVHVKDFKGDRQVEVGHGDLDLSGVIEGARQAGVKWLIVETEEYNMAPMDSVKVGLDSIKALL
jgi:sugar phosphate isomerase/epimerase